MSFAQWNAHVHLEGANAKWIGLGWGITDENSGDPKLYEAAITVAAPAEANASIGKVGTNETVALISRDVPCDDVGIAIEVTYRVSAKPGATGSEFCINIAENAGQKAKPTGAVLEDRTAPIGEDLTVQVVVPGSCAGLTELLNNLKASGMAG